MAEDKKTKSTLITTISLVAFGLLILAGIIYFAWNRTGSTTTVTEAPTSQTTTDNSSTDAASLAANVDKLGPNETKLTPDNYDAFIKQAGVVLVDVYSPTCPHCQKIAPILTDLSNQYVGKVHIGKMSVGIQANTTFILSREKDFAYVPAIWVYKDGVLKESWTGEKTEDEFKTILNKYI
jgi:thioredoxin-like negative regulator of GroEL